MKQTKRQIQKKATKLRHKEQRKINREIKRTNKQKYKDWSKFIKERDNYTCQICNTNHRNSDLRAIQSAHILSKENYPELILDINNGITLCFACHKNASISSHLDGFAFTEFFKNKFPDRYAYLLEKLNNKEK